MKITINRYVATVTALLSSICAFLAWRLFPSHPAAWAMLVSPFFLVWSIPVLFWTWEWEPPARVARIWLWASFISMGFLSFVLTLTVAREAIALVAWAFGWGYAQGLTGIDAGWGVVALAAVLALIGFGRGLTGPRIHRVTVAIQDLPRDLEGFKIAQLSDLHIGPTIGPTYVKRVVRKTNSIGADLIALTGDFVDGVPQQLGGTAVELAQLQARFGTFYVPGNHEYYWDGEGWMRFFEERVGARVLRNSHERVQVGEATLAVAGVMDPASGTKPEPARAAQGSEGSAFKILLAHQPQIAEAAEKAGYDLQLSGHTHAGQFFPWTLVVRRVHRHFAGLSHQGNMPVYVSAGTGSWGPPLRLGSATEITLLELKAAQG